MKQVLLVSKDSSLLKLLSDMQWTLPTLLTFCKGPVWETKGLSESLRTFSRVSPARPIVKTPDNVLSLTYILRRSLSRCECIWPLKLWRHFGASCADRLLTGFLCCRSVWEHHVEEGFSSGPAGISCWIFLPWQLGAARADSAVHRAAGVLVIISHSEQPEERGAGDLCCLGNSHYVTNTPVEQSGRRVSYRAT